MPICHIGAIDEALDVHGVRIAFRPVPVQVGSTGRDKPHNASGLRGHVGLWRPHRAQ